MGCLAILNELSSRIWNGVKSVRGWGDRQLDPGVGCPHRSILEDGGFPEWVVKAAQQNKRYRNYWRSTRNYVSVKTKAGLRNQVRISMQYGAWTWNNDQGWALEGLQAPKYAKKTDALLALLADTITCAAWMPTAVNYGTTYAHTAMQRALTTVPVSETATRCLRIRRTAT